MNRTIQFLCVSWLASTLLLLPVANAADDAELENVRAKLTSMFESIDPKSINPSPLDGWYVVQQGPIVAYVSADARYLLQGDIIDLETRANLTETARNDTRRRLMASLKEDEVITFSPETVKHTVTVFTDVDCTYCRRLHSQIGEYMEQGIEVRYLLYPRNGPASKSWSTSEQVWCAANRNAALTAAKADSNFESSECDATIVQDHYVLGKEVGLSGTPAIVLEDGTLIGGYMPPAQLAARLDQESPESAGTAGN